MGPGTIVWITVGVRVYRAHFLTVMSNSQDANNEYIIWIFLSKDEITISREETLMSCGVFFFVDPNVRETNVVTTLLSLK